MFVVVQGLKSALLLTAGFASAAAVPIGGSVITQGFGTGLAVTQGYGAANIVAPQNTLGGGNLPYPMRFLHRRRDTEPGQEPVHTQELQESPASAPEPSVAPELSAKERKRLRKAAERSLLADGAQRRGFDQLVGLLGTLQQQEQADAQLAALQVDLAQQAAIRLAIEDEELLLLLLAS